jgi:hypothetical protein
LGWEERERKVKARYTLFIIGFKGSRFLGFEGKNLKQRNKNPGLEDTTSESHLSGLPLEGPSSESRRLAYLLSLTIMML